MTLRHSIYDLLDNSSAPIAPAGSWAARREPSLAMARARAAIEARAAVSVRAVIKDRARAYARRPRELDAIFPGLSNHAPRHMVVRLQWLRGLEQFVTNRHFGFGGEIPTINLRAAMWYARWSRRVANRIAAKAKARKPVAIYLRSKS